VLHPRLKTLANKIRDGALRKKVVELLENPTFKANGREYAALPLNKAPAGRSRHHSYPGGYVEHVISTTKIAMALCDSVEKVYHGTADRDLVSAGVLLHDIFKPATYCVNKNGNYDSTPLADYLDHLSLATSELVRRGFPLKLVHIVAAHHGDYGPVRPRTIEALICHLADLADSRLNGDVLSAATYLARKASGKELYGLNSNEAFEIVHSKAIEGWEGVEKTVEKIIEKRARTKLNSPR
jgi:7,8-dihydroneopterin 2',3'-cyclic phosphate phosphodiesterase